MNLLPQIYWVVCPSLVLLSLVGSDKIKSSWKRSESSSCPDCLLVRHWFNQLQIAFASCTVSSMMFYYKNKFVFHLLSRSYMFISDTISRFPSFIRLCIVVNRKTSGTKWISPVRMLSIASSYSIRPSLDYKDQPLVVIY